MSDLLENHIVGFPMRGIKFCCCLAVGEQRSVQDILRKDLLTVLEHAVFGDRLAAEYFLCHLIAGVYGRADVMPLGKFSINMSNCPRSTSYSDLMHHLISNLVTQVGRT